MMIKIVTSVVVKNCCVNILLVHRWCLARDDMANGIDILGV